MSTLSGVRAAHREGRAQPGSTVDPDRPAEIAGDDVVHDREPEARPLAEGLGGEHRLEDPIHDLRIDPAAAVGDLDVEAGVALDQGDGDGAAAAGEARID